MPLPPPLASPLDTSREAPKLLPHLPSCLHPWRFALSGGTAHCALARGGVAGTCSLPSRFISQARRSADARFSICPIDPASPGAPSPRDYTRTRAGVRIQTSTQPIGNALIEFDTPPTPTLATPAHPSCTFRPSPQPQAAPRVLRSRVRRRPHVVRGQKWPQTLFRKLGVGGSPNGPIVKC